MNQGRIWCVVSPSVGLPLLLGSVAVTSLIVHASVMSHTTWMSAYWSGSWRNKVSMNDTPSPALASATQGAPAYAITVSPVPAVPGKSEASFVVTVSTNAPAKVAEAVPKVTTTTGPLALASPAAK